MICPGGFYIKMISSNEKVGGKNARFISWLFAV